jgi:Ca2+-binding RTX toxin-like protein
VGDNITNIAQICIDGTALPGSTVTLHDGATAIGSAVANASTGAWSITASAPLSNGTHSLTATASNSGGASPASSALSVTVDTQAATASLAHASETSGTLSLTGASVGVAGVGYTVTILQDGHAVGTVTPSSGGGWSFTQSTVTNQVHTYTLQTTDAAGNKGLGANELILGTTGHDTLVGGSGDNLFFGGGGADTLTGGSGQNTFIYNAVGDAPYPTARHPGIETITNWVMGMDHIDLTGLGHLTFGGNTQTVTPHSVEWYVSGSNTFIIGDALGRSKPDFMIELTGVHTISSSDVWLA